MQVYCSFPGISHGAMPSLTVYHPLWRSIMKFPSRFPCFCFNRQVVKSLLIVQVHVIQRSNIHQTSPLPFVEFSPPPREAVLFVLFLSTIIHNIHAFSGRAQL